ncbi:MAG: DEAD/DEAH box helicase [Nocardioidaceae bacterium]
MSFVPVTGPAVLRPADPPRDSHVEFSDDRRTVSLPMRAALPVLTKAHARDDLHPSVALLSGAALLGMRLVASGRFEPAEGGDPPRWRPARLDADDRDRIEMLARARCYDGVDEAAAAVVVARVLDAVVDTLPRSAPLTTRRPDDRSVSAVAPEEREARRAAEVERRRADFARRLQARIERHRTTPPEDLPQLVTLSLRVEADEEELVAGAVRLVLQVHDQHNPLHLCDAALLWAEPGPGASHGFGSRARTHASIALRGAAEAWPVLDRLLELRVPDEITLDTDELVSLLDVGVEALRGRGVDVLWPRSLGHDLSARTVLDRRSAPGPATSLHEEPLQTGLLSTEAVFAFRWQLALHGDPLSDDEMDQLARATAPIIKLRNNWTVVDPSIARKARKRLVRHATPVQAVAAALTGVVQVDDIEQEVVIGASLLAMRDRLQHAASREPVDPSPRLHGTLRDYQRHGLTWLTELTGLGLGACLADDMGLGKTVTLIALHLHRRDRGATGATLVVCPASLMGNWEAEVHRFAPGEPVRRFHGTSRDLSDLAGGFVLTTYGTLRSDTSTTGAHALASADWDLVVADEAQHVKNPASATARGLRSVPSRARVALTGTPVENNLTELWAILDWATPGLLGSRNAFRKVWAAPIESGLEPTKARQFAGLVGPFLLRRRKSDPGIAPELPDKTETDHPLGLTREQVVLYESFVRDVMERIERADPDSRRGLVLKLLTGLKQICNHPAHFLKQASGRFTGRSEKVDALDELLATVLAEDGAVLVFTQYVAMARLLETHLTAQGIPHQFLHGGVSVRDREAMVARFQAGEVPVFLLSLKAGGTGLNLTRADHVVHFDRWWNPAVESQATDRAHRIGQTRPVQVHRLITQGTIEERIDQLLARKGALAESVLGTGETALTELSNDELRDLVSLRRMTPPAGGRP